MASLTAIEFHWSEARPRSSAAVLKNEPEMRKVLTIAVFQISSAHWLCSTRTSSGRRSVCWSGSRQQAWAGQMTRVALGRHLVQTRASESTGNGCEITTKWYVQSKNLEEDVCSPGWLEEDLDVGSLYHKWPCVLLGEGRNGSIVKYLECHPQLNWSG